MKKFIILGLLLLLIFFIIEEDKEYTMKGKSISDKKEIATFAGGCFWCIESDFEKQEGVIKAISGYSGGTEENPTYEEVSSGKTGHTETVQITYDPNIINYNKLIDIFWRHHDPTDSEGQFVDRGKQYRPVIFYHDQRQKEIAEQTKLQISKHFDKPIVTEIIKFTKFYPAEEYHQDYHEKNPLKYKFYRLTSGRDQFLKKTWNDTQEEYKKTSTTELKKTLTSLQYSVTQEDATEKPFDNEYWDNKEEGIYVDVVSGEPLFSSKDKYDSKTGWPSFTKPLEEENIVKKLDLKLILPRTELRSKNADSHLGHLFKDGPEPTLLRYCINSAALKFIPKKDFKKEGFEKYLSLFS